MIMEVFSCYCKYLIAFTLSISMFVILVECLLVLINLINVINKQTNSSGQFPLKTAARLKWFFLFENLFEMNG